MHSKNIFDIESIGTFDDLCENTNTTLPYYLLFVFIEAEKVVNNIIVKQ